MACLICLIQLKTMPLQPYCTSLGHLRECIYWCHISIAPGDYIWLLFVVDYYLLVWWWRICCPLEYKLCPNCILIQPPVWYSSYCYNLLDAGYYKQCYWWNIASYLNQVTQHRRLSLLGWDFIERANSTAFLINIVSYNFCRLDLISLIKEHFSIDYQVCQRFLVLRFTICVNCIGFRNWCVGLFLIFIGTKSIWVMWVPFGLLLGWQGKSIS